MKAIRTLIIDDEPVARQGLRKLLKREADVQLCGECADGPAAVQAIEQFEPQLAFVDIQIPGMNGFEILMQARVKRPPLVIFVTAYNLYALRAFEVDALDYLLKPFSDRRFRQALEKSTDSTLEGAPPLPAERPGLVPSGSPRCQGRRGGFAGTNLPDADSGPHQRKGHTCRRRDDRLD